MSLSYEQWQDVFEDFGSLVLKLPMARGRKPRQKITYSSRLGVGAAGQLLAHL
jgi:hypothetical protein